MGLGFGLELCQVEMSPSCVADPSTPASSQGMSFLTGLGLTVRHPPYLKLVISFLFISAAVQVPLAGRMPPGLVPVSLSLRGFKFSLSSTASQSGLSGNGERAAAGVWPREGGAGRREI